MIIKCFALFSLAVCPPFLCEIFCVIRNKIISKRFSILTKCSGKAYLQSPINIKGYKYIKFISMSSCPGLRIECWDEYRGTKYSPNVSIGENVVFNWRCHVGAVGNITIGNNVLIGSNVLITDHSHGSNTIHDINVSPIDRDLFYKGAVTIEDDVWIGENVCILPNVTIGHNSIVGANSVVTKNVPPFSVVAGNPSRIIKQLKNG